MSRSTFVLDCGIVKGLRRARRTFAADARSELVAIGEQVGLYSAIFIRRWRQGRYPFPVPLTVDDETIRVLKSVVAKVRLGESKELDAIRRLDVPARALERHARGPSVDALIADERTQSYRYGGQT